MLLSSCSVLECFFIRYQSNNSLTSVRHRLDQLKAEPESADSSVLRDIYHQSIPLIEQQLWQDGVNSENIVEYQRLFRELESHEQYEYDSRHNFVVVIPVADRPLHLDACLASLLALCQGFYYGGCENGFYRKVDVLVSDDSSSSMAIDKNKEIVDKYNKKGLRVHYFGQLEQLQYYKKFCENNSALSINVLGDCNCDNFGHKGASSTRNITYLKLRDMTDDYERVLFYFVDSDQEFKINYASGKESICALNYFYYLDRIFSNNDITFLTGKVVGDPPVSPAVMAGNYIDDIRDTLAEMSRAEAGQSCSFHDHENAIPNDAVYHDMPELFGFKAVDVPFLYECKLTGKHTNRDCLHGFMNNLSKFFDGEHQTRQTIFSYESPLVLKPARTIYTGNYVFTPAGLDYFIPFAHLKLRMAGPVLGRLIKAEIGEKFVSSSLPMLHKRTVKKIGGSEFRPDIHKTEKYIDISGEYERQFYGDVMLFTIEKLTQKGYPNTVLSRDYIEETLTEVERNLLEKYKDKHEQIIGKFNELNSFFYESAYWWHYDPEEMSGLNRFDEFIANLECNFGPQAKGYQLINSADDRRERLNDILDSIINYPHCVSYWKRQINQ